MKKYLVIAAFAVLFFTIGWFAKDLIKTASKSPQTVIQQIKPRPFDKYTIDNLSKKTISQEKIKIEKLLKEEKTFKSYLFSITFDPTLENKTKKKVSGIINIPNGNSKFPLILMLRGFVDKINYVSGTGTKRASEYFAQNGFITVAPDFFGFGESDKEPDNMFETRFQTYTTVLTLLNSFDSIGQWNKKDVSLWGHSNGGHIALTILEITGKAYPTTLWAPVSKSFPYSILYFTIEYDDLGRYIRKELSKFEEDYDVNLYSIHSYLNRIKAPIQIHQGTNDKEIPVEWSQTLVNNLKPQNPDIKLFIYSGTDHNLQPSWNTVVARDLNFFNKNLIH